MTPKNNENTSSESEETKNMKEEQLRPEAEPSAEGETEQIVEETKDQEITDQPQKEQVQEPEVLEPEDVVQEIIGETPDQAIEDKILAPGPELQSAITTNAEQSETEENEEALLQEAREELKEIAENEHAPSPSIAEHHSDDIENHDPDAHHDDVHGDDDIHGEDDNWFEGMSRENLLEFVINAAEHCDERNMNRKVMQAKSAFNKLSKDALDEAKEKWTADGKDENDFVWEDGTVRDEFNKAFKTYKKSREVYVVGLNVEKEKNLVSKKEILENLKAFVESDNLSDMGQFRKLQEDWRKIGHVPIGDAENIWNSYNFYVNKFYEKRSLYSEFKELDNKRNYSAKEEIISKIEALNNVEDLEEAFRLLRGYQDEWKHIGPVPKEKRDEINLRFRNAVIPVYDKREKISEERNKISEQNYAAKLALIGKIEEIAEFTSARVEDWINKDQELGQWIENWRSIGNIPFKKNDELKERLSAAIRKFNKNKNEFFKQRKHEKTQNMVKKAELCEKVEEFAKSENPGAHRKEVIALQEEWKKSGPAPFHHSDKLWIRFKAACDTFFKNIAAGYTEIEKEQKENLRLKLEVIDKIEALIKSGKMELPEEEIDAFEQEFNNIGHVPFHDKDKIRKRFFAALNKFISKVVERSAEQPGDLMGYRVNMQKMARENNGLGRLETEERKNSRDIKRLEGEIATLENNIEFFRNSKNADDLRNKMNSEISGLKDKMKELQDKNNVIRATARNRNETQAPAENN